MSATVFIDGEAGTTGLKIAERLAGRTDIELIHLSDAERKDADARQTALNDADIAILCLPDDAAREARQMVAEGDTRLIDASTAHRVDPEWVYGFPEMTAGHIERVKRARFVSNPGCYPTGAIALIRPLREAGLIEADHAIVINAISGYSGGGKSLIAEFESDDPPVSFVYATGQSHKHLPEMQLHGLLQEHPIFIPSVGAFAQGMVVKVPLILKSLPNQPSLAQLHDVLAAHYAGCRFVEVTALADAADRIDPQALNGTNGMRLIVAGSSQKGHAVLIAVLDNLGKGASGAAVQNLNLMLGVDETTGL